MMPRMRLAPSTSWEGSRETTWPWQMLPISMQVPPGHRKERASARASGRPATSRTKSAPPAVRQFADPPGTCFRRGIGFHVNEFVGAESAGQLQAVVERIGDDNLRNAAFAGNGHGVDAQATCSLDDQVVAEADLGQFQAVDDLGQSTIGSRRQFVGHVIGHLEHRVLRVQVIVLPVCGVEMGPDIRRVPVPHSMGTAGRQAA